MARELILHIGTTKTGSTSIQYVMDSRRAEIERQGAYWPEAQSAKHQLLALAHYGGGRYHEMLGNPLWQGMEPAARIDSYRAEFAAEMQGLDSGVSRVIISAEQFSEFLRKKSEIQSLHAMLAPHFTSMRVVIYLRRQDSHYSSMYAQMLRMGNLHEPDLAGVRVGFNHDYDYFALLTRWADVFGQDAITPRLFERTGDKPFDVVDDFASLCGLKLSLSADDQKRARNPSMNLLGQRILLQAGALLREKIGAESGVGPYWSRLADAVTRAAPGTGWLPTQDEARAAMKRFADSNEAVRRRWFPERPTLFSPDVAKLPLVPVAVDPQACFEAACAALLESAHASVKRERAASLQMAKLAGAAGNHARMKTALVQVIRADSHNIPARVQLIKFHMARADLIAARASFNAAIQIAPADPALRRLDAALAELEAKAGITARPPAAPRRPGRRLLGKKPALAAP